MVTTVKHVREYNGLKIGDLIRLVWNAGRGSAEAEYQGQASAEGFEIRRIGPAGFTVKGRVFAFRWEDEGVRWQRIAKQESR